MMGRAMKNFIKSTCKKLSMGASILLAAGIGIAAADCGIEAGSVRILSNDIAALRTIADEMEQCASATVTVTKNQTTEHKVLQVPSLTINPAEYNIAFVANNSIVPLLSGDLIQPMDALVEKYGEQLSPQQFIRIDGKIYGIAVMANAQYLMGRGDILQQAGLTMPKTYEEMIEAAKTLRATGVMENPIGIAYQNWYIGAEFVNMYLGTGADKFFQAGTAELDLDKEKALYVLGMMKDLLEYAGPDAMTYGSSDVQALYQDGKIALMNQWGSLAGGIVDPQGKAPEIGAKTILATAPTIQGGDIPGAALWWDGFVIAKNVPDEEAEAAFRAVMYGSRPEMANANAGLAAWVIKDAQLTQATKPVVDTAMAGARPYPMLPTMGLLHTALGDELVDYLRGVDTPEQALERVGRAYRRAAIEAGFIN